MKIINEELLAFLRRPGSCDWCERAASVRQPHHLRCRGMGGGGRLDILINLAALHPLCHQKVQGVRGYEIRLLEKVAYREGTIPQEVVQVRNHLRRLPKETTDDELEELGLLRWVHWEPVRPCGDDLPF
jgi:hypothetical protein